MAKLKRKKAIGKAVSKSVNPVWDGPESNTPQGGVSQSLLKNFLICRERFRVSAIEGWRGVSKFSAAIEYGNMWHECEEAYAGNRDWKTSLKAYTNKRIKEDSESQEDYVKWYNVCLKQFPHYVKYWEEHPEELVRKPLLQECPFRIEYTLPYGRTVYLRGKFDSVDLIGKGKQAAIYLKENKTKGQVDKIQLMEDLHFDLQTLFYVLALRNLSGDLPKNKVAGVRYNVIRRPLSGGKGSIKQKQGETPSEFYDRLEQYFIDNPEEWFDRWLVEIEDKDIETFKKKFLDPCLLHLCFWYEYMKFGDIRDEMPPEVLHYQLPYGIWSPVTNGKHGEVDQYLKTGSTVGLERVETLFPEL